MGVKLGPALSVEASSGALQRGTKGRRVAREGRGLCAAYQVSHGPPCHELQPKVMPLFPSINFLGDGVLNGGVERHTRSATDPPAMNSMAIHSLVP